MEQSNNKNPSQDEAHKPVVGSNEPASVSAASDAMKDLPLVEAPSLDGAKAEEPAAEAVGAAAEPQAAEPILTISSTAADQIDDAAAPIEFAATPQPRSVRFALLAATIAVAAGLGSFVGALAASGIVRHEVADAVGPQSADARNMLQALNALKASLDSANRSAGTQFAKITDRLSNLEHAQAEPAAKLARLADTVDRLDKHAAAPEITGSIAKPAAASVPAAVHILDDWIVRDVRNGRALVENRYGGIFVAAAGGNLPGLGRVEAVRRQDGSWIVVTAKGTITSDR